MKPEIILIAAMDNDRVIGQGNDIPWRGKLPADMAHFQKLTMGHTVVMGRKTWESIPLKYRPLPGRANVVLTRDASYHVSGAYAVRTLDEAISRTGSSRVFIIGGALIYKQYLSVAHRLELTHIDTSSGGDTFFPQFDISEWIIMNEEPHSSDEKNLFPYTFRTYICNTLES